MADGKKFKFSDKKLLISFGVLIFLTIIIGVTAVFQIRGLSQRIQKLGKVNLVLEKAILEMKIGSTLYAMSVRNYVFWKVSHYLGAAGAASKTEDMQDAVDRFNAYLQVYEDNSYTALQRGWIRNIRASFDDLIQNGKQIIFIADFQKDSASNATLNNLLMSFETRLYKIGDFLDNMMGMDNLFEIEKQLKQTESERNSALLFLVVILIVSVGVSTAIALSVYIRRQKERVFRQQLFNQMINLEENERKNLSAEIHDQMGQDLSALKISLGLIEQGIINIPQEIKERLDRAKLIVSKLIEKSHNIAYLLRPPSLDEVGLSESIEELLLDYKHLIGINYTYQGLEQELSLSSEYNLLFYRISQELLTNMAKHSQAKNVRVRLRKNGEYLEFYYEDDGRGFKYNEIFGQPKRRKEDKFKLGLLGLKERVELLDGAMRFDTAPGKGMRVSVKLHV